VSISYGICEAELGAALNRYINALYQQAAAEGTSVYVAAGDEGAASCDVDFPESVNGIAVSGFASTPYNLAGGGTDYSDSYSGTNSQYWSATNTASFGSAKSYIPEMPWNDSCANGPIFTYLGYETAYGASGFCNSAIGEEFLDVVAGSGGPSGCAYGNPDGVAIQIGDVFYEEASGNPIAGARAGWKEMEFNVFGDGGGTNAIFNPGSTLTVRDSILLGTGNTYTCTDNGTSGESNNLTLSAKTPLEAEVGPPSLVFIESNAKGTTFGSCKNAVVIGETHHFPVPISHHNP
jgi:hypothetical protein